MAVTLGDIQQMQIERAQKAILPVAKALKGYQVKSMAQKVYDQGLKKVAWMNSGKVKLVEREVIMDERYTITQKSKADAVLLLK